MTVSGLNRGVHAAALAALPQAGPRRLHRLLNGRDPALVWEQLCQGSVSVHVADRELRRSWVACAAAIDLRKLAEILESLDIWVTTSSSSDHPVRLVADIDPAPVMFRQGRPLAAFSLSVTIVGTRRCSPTGKSVAFELGAALAKTGVTIVSGLALGIDGAAHRGALSVDGAPPVGVVGSGLNVVYPRANDDLWRAVHQHGTLLSESPLGASPEAWRFPARNRLLAALADVVVVVESKRKGGSMLTVEQATRRGITVMAVPGSVRNPASAGTNLLISEGCVPACSADDVLTALSLTVGSRHAAQVPDQIYSESNSKPDQAYSENDSETDQSKSEPDSELDQAYSENDSETDQTYSASDSASGQSDSEPAVNRGGGDLIDAGHNEVGNPDATSVEGQDADLVGKLTNMQQRVLAAVDDNPVSVDRLVLRVGAHTPTVLVAVADLEVKGLLTRFGGRVMRG